MTGKLGKTNYPDREIKAALITGATGMLGATLTRLLLKEGIRVYAVIRPGSKKRENLPAEAAGLTVIEADLSDLETLALPEPADAFFHFAWEGPYGEARKDPDLQDRNADNALMAIRTAARLGAKVFLGAGSQAEYGPKKRRRSPGMSCEPDTEYGRAKLRVCCEGRALAKALGLDFIWCRIFSVYGPYDNPYTLISSAIQSLRQNKTFPATPGLQQWNYLYAEDAAELFFRLAKHGKHGEVYLVAGTEERPLKVFLELLRDAVDPASKVIFGALPYRENQVMVLTADIHKTVETAGYTPDTPFGDGIRKTVRWIETKEKRLEQ